MMELRPYQHDAREAVKRAHEEVASTLVVMATGCGKTVLFSDIIRERQPGRTMVIAHRQELIFQAQKKIMAVTGLDAQVEMGEYHADMRSLHGPPPVVISTVQTHTAGGDGGGRMTKFDPMDFSLLIVDEAHHATSATYRRIFAWYRQNPNLKVLGVTATPDRGDEEALGQVFDSVAYNYEILDAINDGWLVPVMQQMVHVEGLDFSTCKTTAGDLNGADLAEVMENEKNLHGIADPAFKLAGDKRAIIFAASVEQAERLAEILNRHRAGCAGWVCGKTDDDERKRVLRDFSTGALQFMCNVGVLTEGFDDAGVELVFMARPTKSRALYAQMAGRATRPAEAIAHALNDCHDSTMRREMIALSAKPVCRIVDFVGNSGRHKLCNTSDMLGGNVSDEAVEQAVKKARESGMPVDMSAELVAAQKAIELKKKMEAAKRAALLAKAKFSTSNVDPFDVLDIRPVQERGWDKGKQLSERQRELLMRNKINPDGMPYAHAKQLLNEMFRRWNGNLASFGQAKVLKKNGFTAPMRRDEAKKAIDQISIRQGWGMKKVGAM